MRLQVLALAAAGCSAYDNGLGAYPPIGWATWCTDDLCGLFDWCSESEVMSTADALVSSGMRDLGYKLVLLDDCWADTTRDASGNLQPDPTRFPSGIPALVEYIHSRGLLLGLYTCAGPTTCKYNRTGSGGHYVQDAQWFAAMNVDYVKMDNCHHPDTPPNEYYGNFSAALNATGKPVWFATCNWGEDDPWLWAPSIAQSYRSGPDHLPFWSFNASGNGQGVLDIINNMAATNNYSSPFGWNDPYVGQRLRWCYNPVENSARCRDFLETGFLTLSDTESETEFAAWATMGAPLIVATDVRNMSAWKQSVLMNTDILAVNQDTLRAPGRRVAVDDAAHTQVWAKALANGDQAVLFVNGNDAAAQTVAVLWAALGWPATSHVQVYDLWAHAPLGSITGTGWNATVIVHGNAMLRVTLLS